MTDKQFTRLCKILRWGFYCLIWARGSERWAKRFEEETGSMEKADDQH